MEWSDWNPVLLIKWQNSCCLVDIEVRVTGIQQEVKKNKHGYALLSVVWDILLIKCLPHYWPSKMLT